MTKQQGNCSHLVKFLRPLVASPTDVWHFYQRSRIYANPEPNESMAGPSSVAHTLQSPEQVLRNMERLRHEEMPSWNGIAALRNLIDDTQPEVQQRVVEAGAASSIIATMQAWPDHAGIQVCGAGTLVRLAEVDANSRRIVLEAGGLYELAAAVERLSRPEHLDSDGELLGKHIVHKSNFARDCLLKVAGKRTDPRNRKHIDAAIAGGLDPSLFGKLDPKVCAPRSARLSLSPLASPRRLALPALSRCALSRVPDDPPDRR